MGPSGQIKVLAKAHGSLILKSLIATPKRWLTFLAVQNANAALVFEFAYRFINLGRSYFGKLDEESVKNNFVSVLLLLNKLESHY